MQPKIIQSRETPSHNDIYQSFSGINFQARRLKSEVDDMALNEERRASVIAIFEPLMTQIEREDAALSENIDIVLDTGELSPLQIQKTLAIHGNTERMIKDAEALVANIRKEMLTDLLIGIHERVEN